MAIVVAHPVCRVGVAPFFGNGILRVEGERIIVTVAPEMEIAAQAGQKVKCIAQLGCGIRAGQARGLRFAELLEPADQLVVAKPAGSFLDVRLQVIKGGGVFRMPLASQLRQIANQRIAIAVDKAWELRRERGVQYAVAAQEALIEQAYVQLRVAV